MRFEKKMTGFRQKILYVSRESYLIRLKGNRVSSTSIVLSKERHIFIAISDGFEEPFHKY